MELITQYSYFYIILCFLLAFLYSSILYYKQKKKYSQILIRFLFILRFLTICLLSFLLLAPVLKSNNYETSEPVVIIAQDVSSSIKDSTYDLLTSLAEDFSDCNVYSFSFSDHFDTIFYPYNVGLETNFSKLLNNIESRFSAQEISALIIASDGLYNSGANPLYGKKINFPIYPIALGDTNISKDIRIMRVYNNDFAFLDNRFPIEVSVSIQKLKGKDIELIILNNNNVIYSEAINITNNDYFYNNEVLVEATDLGLQKYEIKLSLLEEEKNKKNNSYDTYIDIIDSRYNVLLLHSISHPDLAAYKNTLDKNKNYTVDICHVDDFIASELANYHLMALFGEVNNESILEKIKYSEIPILVFGLSSMESMSSFTSSITFNNKDALQDVYSAINPEFFRFTFSDELKSLVNNAPPLTNFLGKFDIASNVDVVLRERIGEYIRDQPLVLITQEKRKIGFLAAEGFWRWKLYNYFNEQDTRVFDELFIKLTQYMVIEDLKKRFVVIYENQIQENEDVIFEARLFNESFELINDKEVEIIISNEKGDDFYYVFSQESKSYKLIIGKLEPGNYSFVAKVKGQELFQEGVFDIKNVELESLTEVADHHFLSELASYTNGKLFFKNELKELVQEISNHKNHKNIIYETEKLKEIINIDWILLILLFVILLEWIIRRYNGLI